MRLLIVTQAIDRGDTSLGFFHAWAEQFAKKVETLEIICLKQGDHSLPANVSVHSLGKESTQGGAVIKRLRYGWRFLRLVVALRGRYDLVLVHMNEEYVLLGWYIWKAMGKRVGLWRNHVEGNWKAAIACPLADVIFYTSPNTYATRFGHAYRMPTGIEIEKYAGSSSVARSILSLGRIDPVKKVAELLAALELLVAQGAPFMATVVGSATPGRQEYERAQEAAFNRLTDAKVLTRRPGVKHYEVPALMGSHRIFVNLTPPGSFDKTVFEAMAAGCLVVAANPGVKEVIGDLYVADLEPKTIAAALVRGLELPEADYALRRSALRSYVAREHSLTALVDKVLAHLRT